MTDESNPSKKPSSKEPGSADNENTAGDTYNLPGDYRGANIYIKSTIYGGAENNVRLQNLRDFTVQIRDASDQIVGTGIAVSTDGKIVTCAHVVRAAGVEPRNSNSAEIGIYFPQVRGGEEKNRRATIAEYFAEYDDDVVLLQLRGSSPLAPEQIPVLGTASSSDEHPFRSYGYRRLDRYLAGWAHGKIQGCVEAPEGFNIQCEPVQLESSQINSGMSGSAVLDMDRNLVVGIVSETWFPDLSTKDRDTAWAVDGRVLSLEPLGLPLQDISLPLKAAPEPKTDEQTKQQIVEAAQATVAERNVKEKISWNNAPSTLVEWTGRAHLLVRLTEDWNNPQKHVTGLIGFGGEGKSSLARKWVDSVIARSEATKQSPHESGNASQSALAMTPPDGVFWWGFYENRSVDEFFESALSYFGVDSRRYQSSSQRAQIVGVLLNTGRYLFVLDGLEVMQYQDGDQYGLLQSNDLRDLLTFFARPDNKSFCLITSRAPVLDLMEYTTYTHRDVERLSGDDGRTLLRILGVKGNDVELNKVVSDWGGHALTLSILAAYLVDRYRGDIKHLGDIPVPTADEPRYERVHRLLRRYDEHLTKEEREFLKLFSVFRLPVQESAFEKVFEPLLKSLDKNEILKLVSRLTNYRLIRHDEHEKAYTTHPLIRNHYSALFMKGDPSQQKAVHQQIKKYYLSIRGRIRKFPTINHLSPSIEAVHHACCAGLYDEGYRIYEKFIDQGQRWILSLLGAYETDLSLMREFFPNGEILQSPRLSDPYLACIVLNDTGTCLMASGRLQEARVLYDRCVSTSWGINFTEKICMAYENLAELYIYMGMMNACQEVAQRALEISRFEQDKDNEIDSMTYFAYAAYLNGDIKYAKVYFQEAESLQRATAPHEEYLWSIFGIWQADFLRRIGQLDYARKATLWNLSHSKSERALEDVAQCYRVLADIDSDVGWHNSARANYKSALKIARNITVRNVLIEALLARGRWQAKHLKEANAALSDLNEALGYCVESGYRIYEADVRAALAWVYLTNGENEKAKQSAERALQMSNEMGYYWGKVDAEEVLAVIASPAG